MSPHKHLIRHFLLDLVYYLANVIEWVIKISVK